MLDCRHQLLGALQNSLSINWVAINTVVTVVRLHYWSVLRLRLQLADIRAKPYSHCCSFTVRVLGGMLSYRRVKHLIQFCLLLFTQLVGHFEEHTPLILIQSHDTLSTYIAPLHDLAHR